MGAGFVTAGNFKGMTFDGAVVGSGAGAGPRAAAAGAELRAPCRVTGVSLERHHVRLDTDDGGPVTAELVIAADGAMSDVARLAGWRDGRHLIPALEHEIQVDEATFERCARAPRFDVGIVPHGYAWVFPKAAQLSVGVLRSEEHTSELQSLAYLVCRL